MPESSTRTRRGGKKKMKYAPLFAGLSVAALALAAVLLIGLGLLRGGADVRADGSDTSLDLPVNVRRPEDFTEQDGIICYPGAELGVDVSAHQGEIDWAAVRQAGVKFAILRLGYRGYTLGSLNEDSTFRANLAGAEAAGIEVGVYFFSQAISEDEAREEAEFVISALDGTPLQCPVFFDWEEVFDSDSRTHGKATSAVSDCAAAFCETIEAAGYQAGVYFNQRYGYGIMRLQNLTQYAFWIAEYRSYPSFLYDFRYWQYTGEGRIDGIGTDVDIDLRFPVD